MASLQLPGSIAGSLVVSARPADRACCCQAEPVVRIVLPPTPARRHNTDLLLCAHHYRTARAALAVAEVAICELPGVPGDVAA